METVTVTILRNPARSLGCELSEGETGEIPADLAETLVAMTLAVRVGHPKELHGVPADPSIVASAAPVTRLAETESTLDVQEPQAETGEQTVGGGSRRSRRGQ